MTKFFQFIITTLGLSTISAYQLPIHAQDFQESTIGKPKFVSDIQNCPKVKKNEATKASSVWKATVYDVKAIASLGDSVTAALFAANSGGLTEYRGISFSSGGDEGARTIGNFLTHYQKDIIGKSIGSHRGEWCFGVLCPPWQYIPDMDVFNAAQSGARLSNLQHELDYLVPQIQQSKLKKDDIKLLTVFIGSNDLCLACAGKDLDLDEVEEILTQMLKDIRTELPYTIVNLISLLKVSQIYDVTSNDEYCKSLRGKGPMIFECRCAFDSDKETGPKKRKQMDKTAQKYNKLFAKLSKKFNQKKDDTFAVLYDPIFEEMDIRGWNATELLSPQDCFHPSTLAHSHMASAVWNNLWLPSSKKSKQVIFPQGVKKKIPLYCPTADEVIPIE